MISNVLDKIIKEFYIEPFRYLYNYIAVLRYIPEKTISRSRSFRFAQLLLNRPNFFLKKGIFIPFILRIIGVKSDKINLKIFKVTPKKSHSQKKDLIPHFDHILLFISYIISLIQSNEVYSFQISKSVPIRKKQNHREIIFSIFMINFTNC